MSTVEFLDVSFSYPGTQVLDGASFALSKGEIVGLFAPNGAGKSTTFLLTAGLLEAGGGEIHSPDICGLLPERPPLYEHMRVREYLEFIRQVFRGGAVGECMEALDLVSLEKRFIGQLSLGQRRRIGVAQAMIHGPELVLLDEPTLGLDPKSSQGLVQLVNQQHQERTFFVSGHQLDLLGELCDRWLFIIDGKIVEANKTKLIAPYVRLRLEEGALGESWHGHQVNHNGEYLELRNGDYSDSTLNEILSALQSEFKVLEFHRCHPDLKELYFEILESTHV